MHIRGVVLQLLITGKPNIMVTSGLAIAFNPMKNCNEVMHEAKVVAAAYLS